MQERDQSSESDNPYTAPASLLNDAGPVTDTASDDSEPLRPFLTIWIRPRQTIRWIINRDPKMYVTPLICLAGIGQVLDRATMKNAGDHLSLEAILGMAVLFGPLFGLIGLWISSRLIRLSGSWIGGIGTVEEIQTAMAWSCVPTMIALPLWFVQLALFGKEMFSSETPLLDAQPVLMVALLAMGFIELVLSIWGMFLFCNTVAEVQGFRSAWKALGNLFLAGLILVVPLIAVMVVAIVLFVRV